MKNIDQNLLERVNFAYELITNELSKPEEDVVSLSVCSASKQAIANTLRLYLNGKGVDFSNALSIQNLVDLCVANDKQFGRFDFSVMNCRCESDQDYTSSYCLSEDRINKCNDLFKDLRAHVFHEFNQTVA